MHICVLGAGVVGLTTAWALAEAGHQVTIVDRQATPGQGASRANGAQLSYGFVAPLASPETLRHIPGLLLDRQGPLRLAPGLDPLFLPWATAFLRSCRAHIVHETIAAQLLLSALSRAELDALARRLPLEFGRRTAGKLVIHRSAHGFAAARALVAPGSEHQILSGPECAALEPGLRIPAAAIAGGIYTPSEQVGDCAAFCDGLAQALRTRNTVAFQLGHAAAPVIADGRLAAIRCGPGRIEADSYVLALGAGAAAFAREAGFRLPVYPLKGYSLTLRPRTPIGHSVTDADQKIVFAPLDRAGERLIRVAGIADLVGHDPTPDPARLATIRAAARAALDALPGEDEPWAGLRPATPDSRPIIGWSPLPNLFLNTGHGALGWTLAAGSARLAASMLTEPTPALAPAPFALTRPTLDALPQPRRRRAG